jgi:hypothetical protein
MIVRSALFAFLFIAGCVDDAELETDTTSQPVWWIDDTATSWLVGWDSGASPSTPWTGVDCTGPGARWTLASGFTAWREPTTNIVEDYIAKLALHCQDHDIFGDLVPYGDIESYMLSNGPSRPASPAISAGTGFVPIGVRLRVNNVEGHLKNIALFVGTVVGDDGEGLIYGYTAPLSSAWATPYAGSAVDYMICPEQYVLTKVEVRATGNGKIRALRIRCASATDL